MKLKHCLTICTLSASLLLMGCASTGSSVNTADLNNLQQLKVSGTPTGQTIGGIRMNALKETALSLGAQGALSNRASVINEETLQNAASLDQIFNFERVMLDSNVLPPVLVQAKQSLNLDSSTTIRLSGQVYKIEAQSRFVTAPPNWRQYLLMNYPKPDAPDETLLPKNKAERAVWTTYINKGWQEGITQANDIFSDNLARLKQDFSGMILYRKLLAANIVSKPFVAQTNLGVTSNKDHSQLYVNDRVMRITALPQLNANASTWKPVVEVNDVKKSTGQ